MKLLEQTTDPDMKNQLVRVIVGAYAIPGQAGHAFNQKVAQITVSG